MSTEAALAITCVGSVVPASGPLAKGSIVDASSARLNWVATALVGVTPNTHDNALSRRGVSLGCMVVMRFSSTIESARQKAMWNIF
jgi:hypothetical protein